MTTKHPRTPLQENQAKRNTRFLRLPQIIGQAEVTPEQANSNRKAGKSPASPKSSINPIIPVSRASWWKGVKDGKYPKPIKLGSRTTVWREVDVMNLVDRFGGEV